MNKNMSGNLENDTGNSNNILIGVFDPKISHDRLFLFFLVAISIIPYVKDLGFYSWDWTLLANMSLTQDKSIINLFKSLYNRWAITQPASFIYIAVLYKIFGINPSGYHFINAVILISNTILLYTVLLSLNQNRTVSLSVAIIYSVLPHYSSVRFWLQGFFPNLSMTFYFISLYSVLRVNRIPNLSIFKWKTIALATMICSILVNNLTIPLFLFNPFIVKYFDSQQKNKIKKGYSEDEKKPFLSKYKKLFLINFIIILPVIILKIIYHIKNNQISFIEYVQNFTYSIIHLFDLNRDFYSWGLNFTDAFFVAFGKYGLCLPLILFDIISNYKNLITFTISGFLGLIIYSYLNIVMDQTLKVLSRYRSRKLLLRGLIIFTISYSIFLFDWGIQFTATGSANINSIAAAIGVSFIIVAVIGLICNCIKSEKLKKDLYSISIAIISMIFLCINLTLSSYWLKAYEKEQQILYEIKKQFPFLPSNSTMILDGFNPYVGPVAIFHTKWVIFGALSTIYQTGAIQTDIATSNLKLKIDGIYSLDNGKEYKYPYKNLYIFNHKERKSFRIENVQGAENYFKYYRSNHNLYILNDRLGFGDPVFKFRALVFK